MMDEYRQHLVLARQKAQEDYDKTLIYLSGGALGISFAFIDKLTDGPPFAWQCLLFIAWGSWIASLVIMLLSFRSSRAALERAIEEVDNYTVDTVDKRPGGIFAVVTEHANWLGLFTFLAGLVAIGVFVWKNLGST